VNPSLSFSQQIFLQKNSSLVVLSDSRRRALRVPQLLTESSEMEFAE
jgi:hypothetical protein